MLGAYLGLFVLALGNSQIQDSFEGRTQVKAALRGLFPSFAATPPSGLAAMPRELPHRISATQEKVFMHITGG